jgi:hypothetical protein
MTSVLVIAEAAGSVQIRGERPNVEELQVDWRLHDWVVEVEAVEEEPVKMLAWWTVSSQT